MNQLYLKRNFLLQMRRGEKTLEVRVGYKNIKKISSGENLEFLCQDDSLTTRVTDIRTYASFNAMLENEDCSKVVPGASKPDVEARLSKIFPPNKEALGVYVFEIQVLNLQNAPANSHPDEQNR